MVDVRRREPRYQWLRDLFHEVVYPLVPLMGIACVWANAYAHSLESRVQRDLRPSDDANESTAMSDRLEDRLRKHEIVEPPTSVTGIDTD